MCRIEKIRFRLPALLLFVYATAASPNGIERGIELFEANKFDKARSFFESYIQNSPDDDQGYYYLGRISFDESDYKQAEKWLKEALQRAETSMEYNLWLGRIYGTRARTASFFKKPGLAKKSKRHFKRAVELDGQSVEARMGLLNFYLNAPGIVGGGTDKALGQAKSIVELDERSGQLAFARIYEKKKDWPAAEAAYRSLEENHGDSPDFYQFYNTYGYLLLNQKRYDEAIARFEKQVHLAPDKANPHDSLGDGYRAVGRFLEAAEEYRKSLHIDPTFSPSKKKLKEVEKKLQKLLDK